jgi:hypothetical protein
VGNATHNAVSTTARVIETVREQQRERELAAAAWARYAAASEHPYIEDFAEGFKAGFADYLYAGGTGEPPPLPPKRYWASRYESAEGAEVVRRWYAGWRAGAAEARASGLRQFVTLLSPPPDPAHPTPEPTAHADDPDKVAEFVLPAPHASAEGAEVMRQWNAGWLRRFVTPPGPPSGPPPDLAHPAPGPAAHADDPDKGTELVLPAPRPLPAPEKGSQLPPAPKGEESSEVRE